MKRSRHTLSKPKPRHNNNRRRVMKKSVTATINARHNIYRLRIQEEMESQETQQGPSQGS